MTSDTTAGFWHEFAATQIDCCVFKEVHATWQNYEQATKTRILQIMEYSASVQRNAIECFTFSWKPKLPIWSSGLWHHLLRYINIKILEKQCIIPEDIKGKSSFKMLVTMCKTAWCHTSIVHFTEHKMWYLKGYWWRHMVSHDWNVGHCPSSQMLYLPLYSDGTGKWDSRQWWIHYKECVLLLVNTVISYSQRWCTSNRKLQL